MARNSLGDEQVVGTDGLVARLPGQGDDLNQ